MNPVTVDVATVDGSVVAIVDGPASVLEPAADDGPGAARLPGSGPAGASTSPSTVPLEELRRAWAALQAGRYRTGASTSHSTAHQPVTIAPETGVTTEETANASMSQPQRIQTAPWGPAPDERLLPVIGCGGSVGASTFALALAVTYAARTRTAGAATGRSQGRTVMDGASTGRGCAVVRVVDCGSLTGSGLAAASTFELGRHPSGWRRGTRGDVLLERADGHVTGPDAVPAPCPWPAPTTAPVDDGGRLTVLDVGWDLERVLHHPSWISSGLLAAPHVVLVTTATVPGLRRLEVCLDLFGDTSHSTDAEAPVGSPPTATAVVLGPSRRRWPRAVAHGLGTRTRALDREGRITVAPYDRRLAVSGPDPAPLPAPLMDAATCLLDQLIIDTRGATR